MIYRIAAIDVHKKMVAVVIADVAGSGEYEFKRSKWAATPDQLQRLSEWLVEREVEEVVMESTAQYWRPIGGTLEQYWQPKRQERADASRMSGTLHLCQAKSNRAPRGRKSDFADAERLLKRLVAKELVLSFVPNPEQRLWRTITRRKAQLTCAKVGFGNQLESLLEQAHIKLSSFLSDLLSVSGIRILNALAEGESDPAKLAPLADCRVRAKPAQLRDAQHSPRDAGCRQVAAASTSGLSRLKLQLVRQLRIQSRGPNAPFETLAGGSVGLICRWRRPHSAICCSTETSVRP